MKGLVVFDWNGTVIDDIAFALIEANAAITRYGGKPLTLEEFQSEVFTPRIDFYLTRDCHPRMRDEVQEVAHYSHEILHQYSSKVSLRRGVKEVIQFLAQKGISMVILSNHIESQIQEQLARYRLTEYFATVLANIDSSDYYRGVTKGPRLKHYLDGLPTTPEQIVLIGDTVEEIEIAREVGGIAIALEGGINSRGRLELGRPDLLLRELEEALPFFQELYR